MSAVDTVSDIVDRLRAGVSEGVLAQQGQRITQLRQLRRLLVEQEERLVAALAADLGKPPVEAYATEVGFTIAEIDHAIAGLPRWMVPERVKVPLAFKPGSARIVSQPLGVVLVIAPWNYPVQLSLAPLAAALTAGNAVVLKPSELAPATSAALADLVPAYLDSRAVAVVEGGASETRVLLAEHFDHILYTGGSKVAKIVMRAAAEHLTPVTLELGGKSPAIVAADADADVAAHRITWGRFTNAGQTCVAPDYVLVHRDVEDEFLGGVLRAVHDFYGDDPRLSADYGRIVDDRHFDRLTGLIAAGGYEAVVAGGVGDRETRYLAPTVLAGVQPDAAVMEEEIFGPILPVLTVADVDEAVRFVNAGPAPLAMYLFTNDDAAADRIIERTRSGGATVNHTMLHVAVPALPFGGVGASGTGAYHGKAGFDTFSHRRSVLAKPARPDVPVLYPPYKRWKEAILRRVL
jgi:aldehyde dehydrogenase (NAD+)